MFVRSYRLFFLTDEDRQTEADKLTSSFSLKKEKTVSIIC